MSSTSKKRRLGDTVTKYYAVRAGKKPGVYLTWKECQDNTTGFKGAAYKAFTSQQDAQDFVDGKNPPGPSDSKNGEEKFYAVAVGHKPGVYLEWTECQEQIKDTKGPKYKKFGTRAEAEEFIRLKGNGSTSTAMLSEANVEVEEQPNAKKIKIGSSKGSTLKDNLRVYTDGSSRGNGKLGAAAGVGVFFGPNDFRNVSEPLEGTPQTNQRAELTGILRALEIVPPDRGMEIITDSKYSIDCVTTWYKGWMARDWISSGKTPVKNKDLVIAIRKLIDARDARKTETKLTWVKGHDNDPGNEAADRLAVAGAFAPR